MSAIDRQIAVAGDWALASDGIQWILQRRWKEGGAWQAKSFVRSTRDVLARCMREKGIDNVVAGRLLSGLPATFDQWKASRDVVLEAAE